MLSFYSLPLFFLSLAGLLHAKSSDGDSVLVLVEDAHKKDFSLFFDDLKGVLRAYSNAISLIPG
jgi:oligosaccharyltransferase complex subunit beta